MPSEWYDLANEYTRTTAVIYMIRHMGGNYKKEARKARQMLEELRRMGFPQMAWLEGKLRWALEDPPGVGSDDSARGHP